MNIDELKAAWQREEGPPVTEDKWRKMLQQHPDNPIAKLKKRTRFEWIFGCLLQAAIVGLFLFIEKMPAVALVYVLMGGYSFFYSKQQMRLLLQMEKLKGAVKETLGQQLLSLEQFFRRNIWYSTLLTPALLVFLGWMYYRKSGQMPVSDFPDTFPEALLPYGGMILLITAIFHVTARISIRVKYGKHLRELRRKAAELEGDT